jgi:hypothetical protein
MHISSTKMLSRKPVTLSQRNLLMNTTDFWKKAASSNKEIVSQNITEGGFICDFKPRSDINDRMCGRFVVNPVRPPFEETAEVGFYLRHGENSRCVKEFVKRHSNIGM